MCWCGSKFCVFLPWVFVIRNVHLNESTVVFLVQSLCHALHNGNISQTVPYGFFTTVLPGVLHILAGFSTLRPQPTQHIETADLRESMERDSTDQAFRNQGSTSNTQQCMVPRAALLWEYQLAVHETFCVIWCRSDPFYPDSLCSERLCKEVL